MSATPVLTLSCQANSSTSEGGNCVAQACEQGCIELAITILITFGDLTVVKNDAEGLEHDRGHQRPQSFSDVQCWTRRARMDSRSGKSRSRTGNRESANDSHHALKPTSAQQPTTSVQVALWKTWSRRSPRFELSSPRIRRTPAGERADLAKAAKTLELMPRRTLMQLRDNWRGVARETRAQPFARISTCRSVPMPPSGKSADFTVVMSVIEETVVVHRKREREMKEREALDPKRSMPWNSSQRGRWSLW